MGGSSRSKSAALRSLRRMLLQRPELIQRMEEDWTQAGVAPGGTATSVSSVTAFGWLEQRPKIQNFPVPARAAWSLAGVWDILGLSPARPCGRGKGKSCFGRCVPRSARDRQGSWLVAGEVSLEDAHPFSSFAAHRPLEHWESPHTKLELILAKLHDIYSFQDKKQKLTSSGRKREDSTSAAEKDKGKDTKKKKKEGRRKRERGGENRSPNE